MSRTITKVCPNIDYLGRTPSGVSEGLKRAIERAGIADLTNMAVLGNGFTPSEGLAIIEKAKPAAAAQWFRDSYDSDMQDGLADVWETAPLGRWNDGAGQWRWVTEDEFASPIMRGFEQFLHGLPSAHDQDRVRASFGRPPHNFHFTFRRDANRLPPCQWQFDDVSGRAPKVARLLNKFGPVRGVVLETALTDTPTEPRRATRFVTFPGYDQVVQRVRAGIVSHWVERNDDPSVFSKQTLTPISSFGSTPGGMLEYRVKTGEQVPGGWWLPTGVRLSLFLPAADCETMTAETLARVLPLFVDVSIQGPIPAGHMEQIKAWRVGLVANQENMR